jgi:hypothetical protein
MGNFIPHPYIRFSAFNLRMTPKQLEILPAFVASSPPPQQAMAIPNLDLCVRLLHTDGGAPEIKGMFLGVQPDLFKVSGQSAGS